MCSTGTTPNWIHKTNSFKKRTNKKEKNLDHSLINNMQTKKVIPVAIISASLLTFLFYENVLKRDFFSASAIRERLATWRHGAAAELARTHEALESPHSSHRDTEGNDSLSASTTKESQSTTTKESQQNATTRESQNVQLRDEQSSPVKKVVVLSTKFFSLANSSKLASQGCPEARCFITSNASEAEDADAVVFHAKFTTLNSVPKKRHSHQRYIWYNLESPPHTRRKARLMNFYNWTYTYHRNSDLLRPYGALLPLTGKGRLSQKERIGNGKGKGERRNEKWGFKLKLKRFILQE